LAQIPVLASHVSGDLTSTESILAFSISKTSKSVIWSPALTIKLDEESYKSFSDTLPKILSPKVSTISIRALKKNQEIVETLGDRILGRVSLKDLYDSSSNLIVKAGDQITDLEVLLIEKAKIDSVEVRSPLTCEARTGICAKCYG
jgi:hypothetical protein